MSADTDEAIVSGDGDDEKSNSPLREQVWLIVVYFLMNVSDIWDNSC